MTTPYSQGEPVGTAAYVFIPGMARYRCTICGAPTDQLHHADYRRQNELDEHFDRLPLCEAHHVDLHQLHDAMGRRVSLTLWTLAYIASQAGAAQKAARFSQQLDFGQQSTPQGETWRRWETIYREFGHQRDDWEDWDDVAGAS